MADEKGVAAVAAPAPEAPKVDAIQVAIDEARSRIEKGEPMIPEEEGEEKPPSGDTAPAKEKEDGGSGADEEPAKEDEGEEEEDEKPETDEGKDDLTVLLPGRREGEEDFEITVDSPEAKERLAQLRNGYLRGEEVRARTAQLDTEQAELADFRAIVETDPVGLVKSAVPQWARSKLALSLLTDEKVWADVKDKVALLDDPDEFRFIKSEVEKEEAGLQKSLKESAELRREQMHSATQVVQSIGFIAPPDLDEGEMVDFSKAALDQLKLYATRTGAITIAPADVPAILAPWMRSVGVDPVAAAARLMEVLQQKDRSPNGKGKAPAPKRAAAKSSPSTAKTGKAFVDASGKRRAAASAAPAGAGTSALRGAAPPANQTIEERIEWLRKNGGIGGFSGT